MNLTPKDAVELVIKWLNGVEVKGYENTSAIVESQRLLRKVANFLSENTQNQEEAQPNETPEGPESTESENGGEAE